MKELTEKEALYKIAAYCSTTEHCLSEVKEKLEDLKTELGNNFIYIISNQLSLLDRIFE